VGGGGKKKRKLTINADRFFSREMPISLHISPHEPGSNPVIGEAAKVGVQIQQGKNLRREEAGKMQPVHGNQTTILS